MVLIGHQFGLIEEGEKGQKVFEGRSRGSSIYNRYIYITWRLLQYYKKHKTKATYLTNEWQTRARLIILNIYPYVYAIILYLPRYTLKYRNLTNFFYVLCVCFLHLENEKPDWIKPNSCPLSTTTRSENCKNI